MGGLHYRYLFTQGLYVHMRCYVKKKRTFWRAPNEDSKQPAHARSLIRIFVVRMKKLCILGYPKHAQWRFWPDCADASADLSLRWALVQRYIFWRFGSYFRDFWCLGMVKGIIFSVYRVFMMHQHRVILSFKFKSRYLKRLICIGSAFLN